MKSYLLQFILSFLTSLFTVFVVVTSIRNGVSSMMAIGFPILGWLCFHVPAVGTQILWGNFDRKVAFKKFLSDSFSTLVTILIIAIAASFFAL